MNSDQDILKYLINFSKEELMESSAFFCDFKQIINKITQAPKTPPTQERLQKLNQLRIFSSNTLSKEPQQIDLDRWNEAQSLLYKLLVSKNRLSLKDISLLNSTVTGKNSALRDFEIETGAGKYLSSGSIQLGLENYFKTLDDFSDTPIRQAFESYLHLVTIHPFENGNGRTARLAADFYLFKNNILPLCFKNSIQSHVALVRNNVKRIKDESFLKFLKAVEFSHDFIFSSEQV